MVLAFIVVALAAAALFIFSKYREGTKDEAEEPQYKRLEALFTPAERSFFGVLQQAVSEDAVVFGKVRVADVLEPVKGLTRGNWQRAFNKISAKHFDFVVCDKAGVSVLCAIELNDQSHNSKRRQERDGFLKAACEAAGVPLIQVCSRWWLYQLVSTPTRAALLS